MTQIAAAEAQLTKAAVRLLGLGPLPDGFHAFLAGFLVHGQGVGLNGDFIGGIGMVRHNIFPPSVGKSVVFFNLTGFTDED